MMAQQDTLTKPTQILNTVLVRGYHVSSPLKGSISSTIKWDMQYLNALPKILGNADPLHYAQLLPGIQTCNEYDSGIYIQGCDQSQNYVNISDAPIYNAQHLLGFFSIFNASHFTNMSFTTSRHSASYPNRLGGEIEMELPDSVPSHINGEMSIGLISSQATLKIPCSPNSALFISARSAYLNLLYSKWLEAGSNKMKYGFEDYNLTYLYKPTKFDLIRVNTYHGNDRTQMADKGFQTNISLKWGNTMFSTDWSHLYQGKEIKTTVYYTYYHNMLDLVQDNVYMQIPSSIGESGLRSMFKWGNWTTGTDIAFRHIEPQNPEVRNTYQHYNYQYITENSQEYSAFINYNNFIGTSRLTYNIGARASVYNSCDKTLFYAFDPSFTLKYETPKQSEITFSIGTQHQYLDQTGFSTVGLPTNFWFSTCNKRRPQYSYYTSASYDIELSKNMYHLTTEIYYKQLFHQEEYIGNIMDIMTDSYHFDKELINGHGYNVGINFMLSKRRGFITGWLSYSYGLSRRKFQEEGFSGYYPSNHERLHELNAVATCHYQKRWEFGITGIFASGTPFTKVNSFYLINNHLISEFGKHNGCRLNPYYRLDLSVNYFIKNKTNNKQIVNLSIYNLTMTHNQIFYRLKIYKGQYAYKPMSFFINILPSVSYYIKF